jgi:hypothetical protein
MLMILGETGLLFLAQPLRLNSFELQRLLASVDIPRLPDYMAPALVTAQLPPIITLREEEEEEEEEEDTATCYFLPM